MEVGLGCERCRTWEEEMYWKRFNSMHFFQILPNDFHHHLVLPLKFAENMITELPGKVSLIGPSGTVWDVAVAKTNNITFGGDGWKEFVKAHDLEVNCILVFKYKRNFGFEVLIFDQVSLCEKEAAYFVKKCEHTKSNHHENDKKRSSIEAFSTEVVEDEDKDDNDSEFVALKKARKDCEKLVCVGERDNPQTQQKCSSDGIIQGRGTPTEVVPLKSASELHDKSGAEKPKGNEAAEKQHVPETGGSTLEMGHSHESSQTKGKKPNENEAAEEQNSPEIGGSTLETVHSHKPRTRGRPKKRIAPRSLRELIFESRNKPNGNGATKDQNSPDIGGSTDDMVHSHKSVETRGRPKKRVASKSPRKLVFGSDSAKKRYSKEYISNRRPVAEMEKENALQRAREEQNERSFTAVMRPTSVYRRFFLNVPTEWMHKHLPHRHHEVVLRVGEKTWVAMFYYYNSQKGGGISGTGWKKFALDNFLEEFDVCHFKLASQKDDPDVVFDVDIFRVIPEIVAPSPNAVVSSTIA